MNYIFLFIFLSILSANIAAPTNKQPKAEQASSANNQNANSFTPLVTGKGNHGSQSNEGVQDKSQGNDAFNKGQVFEFSYSTNHQEPQGSFRANVNEDKQETILANGSDNFADHELARQALPKFFSYSNGALNDNSSDPGLSIKQFEEAFKSSTSGTSENPTLATFQPALGEVASASYFSYAPPSVPPFMRMGFSESEIDDDIDDDSLDNGDLDYKPSSPKKLERSSDYKDDGESEQDPKVKMVQVLMGRRNEKGKPWGTKTTLVYRDPKDANNYMQVTEVKMSVKSKKDRPELAGDEVSKVSKSSFHGSRYSNQPSLSYGGDFLELNEPPEPSF